MAGLVPAIHAVMPTNASSKISAICKNRTSSELLRKLPDFAKGITAWMAGTSPATTMQG